jgi:hypothetical protein
MHARHVVCAAVVTYLFWAIPLGIAIVLLIPIGMAIYRLADEASRLRSEVRDLGALRPAVVEVRNDSEQLRRTVEYLRQRA